MLGGFVVRKFFKNNFKKAVICVAALLCLSFVSCTFSQDIQPLSPTYSLPLVQGADSPAESDISAQSAIVIEASSGETLWSKNCDKQMPMASTTKIMTALVALERCDIQKTVKISPLAVGVEGSSIYLYAGEELTMENLLYAMLLESANDAAAAIAIEVGGSIDGFSKLMNKKAAELGLKSTSFENPHGLDGENHYTTAKELAIITREAMKNESFRKIVSTYKTTIPLNKTEGTRVLINHNKLIKSYKGALGVKTGFTKKSGRCLVSAAEVDGVEYICVTLNAPSDWNDHTKLLDYASSLYERVTLCNVDEISHSLPLVNCESGSVTVSNKDQLSLILPRERGNIEYVIELPHFYYNGVRQGEELGSLIFYLDGEIIASTPMCAQNSVKQIKNKTNFFERIASLFD